MVERTLYTLVRHSGYTVGGDEDFKQAVQEVSIETSDCNAVLATGGRIFDDYIAAYTAGHLANYPETGNVGIIPRAVGKFVEVEGVGEVFVPAT